MNWFQRATIIVIAALASVVLITEASADGTFVQRWAGASRIETAVVASQQMFPEGAERVYLVNANAWPDALALAPASDGPILYVDTNFIPEPTRNEILRLNPDSIVIAGGKDVVSDEVYDEAMSYQKTYNSALFIVPHPDDEFSAWSMVQRTRNSTFVLLTQGEGSAVCAAYKECKQRRVQSWNEFLRNSDALNYSTHVFDYGDGSLEVSDVSEAVAQVGGSYDVIVTGAYYHDAPSSEYHYDHPDHKAVHDYVASIDGVRNVHSSEAGYSLNVLEYDRLFGQFMDAYEWVIGNPDNFPNFEEQQFFVR